MISPIEWKEQQIAEERADELQDKINSYNKYAVLRAADETFKFLHDLHYRDQKDKQYSYDEERLRQTLLPFTKIFHVDDRNVYD